MSEYVCLLNTLFGRLMSDMDCTSATNTLSVKALIKVLTIGKSQQNVGINSAVKLRKVRSAENERILAGVERVDRGKAWDCLYGT